MHKQVAAFYGCEIQKEGLAMWGLSLTNQAKAGACWNLSNLHDGWDFMNMIIKLKC